MKNADHAALEASRFNEQTHRLISALLISFMMTAAGITLAQAGALIAPGWRGGYLAAIGFFVALERFYSYRMHQKLSAMSRESVVLFSTQLIVNLLLIKLIVTLTQGMDALLAEIPLWQQSFGTQFFSPAYLLALMFAFLVWVIVGMLTGLLDAMGLDAGLVNREVLSAEVRDQAPPRQRLMAVIFSVGAGLMFLTAISRVDLRSFFANQGVLRADLSVLAGGGAGTLLYFLFGLALLSQSNYIRLNTRWFIQQVPVDRDMASRWAMYSLGFLILILLIASILPTNYSLGLISVLGYLLDMLLAAVMIIIGVVLGILSFLISLPFMLFGVGQPVATPDIAQPELVATPPPMMPDPGSPLPWLDLLRSLVFWAIFLVVIGYSISQYLRQHEEILTALRKIPGTKIISAFWRWLTGIFGTFNRRVSAAIETRRARQQSRSAAAGGGRLARLTGLRRLSARQKVRFYYQALLRRGAETGLPRQESQTPEEYAAALEHTLPEVEHEIASLTDAFSEARYSRHPVAEEEVDRVKSIWAQIRRVFRRPRG